MVKIQLPENIRDSGLALPESTPKTLIEVSSESLPYACQCPLCGGLFNIPEGLLYKIEEDNLVDGDFDTEMTAESNSDIDINTPSSESEPSPTSMSDTASADTGVGEANDTAI